MLNLYTHSKGYPSFIRYLKFHSVAMNTKASRKREADVVKNVNTKVIKVEPFTQRVDREFFDVPCIQLANSLLGMLLVRVSNGEVLKGRIVETECYLGGADKASQTYNGKRTPRNEPMYMDPGTAFVYMTYGMYYCFNISSTEPGGAVLIRALEPILGEATMLKFRTNKRKKTSKSLKPEEICNGPSKLCTALAIDKVTCNKLDMCTSDVFWVEKDERSADDKSVISAKRIGIDSAGPEWAGKPLRFYVFGNVHVSKRDKQREKEFVEREGER